MLKEPCQRFWVKLYMFCFREHVLKKIRRAIATQAVWGSREAKVRSPSPRSLRSPIFGSISFFASFPTKETGLRLLDNEQSLFFIVRREWTKGNDARKLGARRGASSSDIRALVFNFFITRKIETVRGFKNRLCTSTIIWFQTWRCGEISYVLAFFPPKSTKAGCRTGWRIAGP